MRPSIKAVAVGPSRCHSKKSGREDTMILPTWMIEELKRRGQEERRERPRLQVPADPPMEGERDPAPARHPADPVVIAA